MVDVYTVEAVCGLVLVGYELLSQRTRARTGAAEFAASMPVSRDGSAAVHPLVADLHHPLATVHRSRVDREPARSSRSPSS